MNNHLLILVGPTSSGKSELAVKLAKKFNGEIISCDSRQIYKGMDLGTGKVLGKWAPRIKRGRILCEFFIYKKVVHHLIDFVNPKRQYSAALFKRDAEKCIADILSRGKLPILCGGTAQWIDAVAFNQNLPNVMPNPRLRARLEKESASDLYLRLKKLDPVRAKSIDRQNKRRLIRALEIVIKTGHPIPRVGAATGRPLQYVATWIGISLPRRALYKKIDLRLKQRLKAGMIQEVQKLHRDGLSWKRLEHFGLEYKFVSLYLQKKLSYDEMLTQLSYAIKHYSKRQMTWWKRNKKINWIANYKQIKPHIKEFLGLPG